MGNKRRNRDSDGEEDPHQSVSDSDAQPKKPIKSKLATSKGKEPSKQKTVKKPKFDESGEEPLAPARDESKQPAVKVLKNAEGEKYVELGKKKRAAVRPFKGQVFIDIREFYGTEGDEKPGKKGISLAIEQWEALKRSISTIDSLLTERGKK